MSSASGINSMTDPYAEGKKEVVITKADALSLARVLTGQSLPLDMEPWRDALLRRLTNAIEASDRESDGSE